MDTNDYITIVKNSSPCNKRFTRTPDGIIKTPAANIYDATATTVHVPNPEAMARLLREVGEDEHATLILGYIAGTKGGAPYNLITSTALDRLDAMGGVPSANGLTYEGHVYHARLKDTFSPSSWFVFDYDEPAAMPEILRSPDFDSWVGALALLMPGIRDVGRVMLPSSSSRILDNGIPVGTANKHMLVQAQDAADVERFGKMMFLHALQMGLGFTTTTKGGAQRRQSIFDPTTFSRERLLFEGKPIVEGEGLAVGRVDVHVQGEGRLDTRALASITDRVEGLEVSRSSSGNYMIEDYTSWTHDVEIDTKDHGWMTFEDYMDGDYGKIKCQSPFRGSESMAGYLNMHKSGAPFLFDVGSQTKYFYRPSVDELFAQVQKTAVALPLPPVTTRAPAPPVNFIEKEQVQIQQQTSTNPPPVANNLPILPQTLPILPQTLPIPPNTLPALAIVGGTDYEAEFEAKFQTQLNNLRRSAPNSEEKLELLKGLITIIEKVDSATRQIRWNESLAAASGDEINKASLEKIRKEVRRELKKGHNIETDTPQHRRPLFGWPDVNPDDKPFCTIDNARYMFERLDVKLRYNRMAKDLEAVFPWTGLSDHNATNNAFVHIESIGQTNGLTRDALLRYALTLSDGNTFNPVDEWISSKPWDGTPRFPILMATLKYKENELAETLVRKWMISCVAAVYELEGVRSQGVLTLQGPQHSNKSYWLSSLVGDMKHFFLYHGDFRVDKKDSHILAFSYWIAELPEVDVLMPTRDKEEQFKSIVDRSKDEIRRPYDRVAGKWARSTVFCATANPDQFLKDTTGTRRSWTLAVEETFPDRMPDMQQMWAEVRTWYDAGATYSLTGKEVATLNKGNDSFATVLPIEEEILEAFNWESLERGVRMSATQVVKLIHPGAKVLAYEAKQAGEIITKLTGKTPQKGNKGKMWYMPPLAMFDNPPD